MRLSLLALALSGILGVATTAQAEAVANTAAGDAKASTPICLPQEFNGVADGKTLNTKAIQSAIDKCAALGGGEVRLSEGLWLSGPIELKSNIIFNVTEKATLKADNSANDFIAAYIGKTTQPNEAFLLANQAKNVKLIGSGTVDGSGKELWWDEAQKVREAVRSGNTAVFEERFPGVKLANGMPRPWLVEFNEVDGAYIADLTFTNSPMWNVVLRNSQNLDINHIKVTAPTDSPNTDGVDIVSSQNVHVTNIDVFTGDDNIAIKSGVDQGTAKASSEIVIEDSVMHAGHGISIGSETANGIGSVTVRNTTFDETENGVRIKSARDRGNNIGPLHVENVTMEKVSTPILVTFSYAGNSGAAGLGLVEPLEKMEVTPTTPHVDGVYIKNLKATGANIAALLSGLPESIITHVVLEDVEIESQMGIQARYVNGSLINTKITSADQKPVVRGPDAKLREAR